MQFLSPWSAAIKFLALCAPLMGTPAEAATRTVPFTADTLSVAEQGALDLLGLTSAPASISGSFSFEEPNTPVLLDNNPTVDRKQFQITAFEVLIGGVSLDFPIGPSTSAAYLDLLNRESSASQDTIDVFAFEGSTGSKLSLPNGGTLRELKLEGTYETSDAFGSLDSGVPPTSDLASPFSSDNAVSIGVNDDSGQSFVIGYRDVSIKDVAPAVIPLPATLPLFLIGLAAFGLVKSRRR